MVTRTVLGRSYNVCPYCGAFVAAKNVSDARRTTVRSARQSRRLTRPSASTGAASGLT